jgi:F-type H+-transporting ATPase subunit b
MPQFDPTWFATQIFWLAITFGALYWILTRAILPRMSATIDRRTAQIEGDLKAAERARAEAETTTRSFEDALAKARAEAAAVVAAANQAIAAESARRQAEVADQLARRTAEAEARIAALRAGLRQDVRTIAAETAGALVAKLTGEAPDQGAVAAAVDRATAGSSAGDAR